MDVVSAASTNWKMKRPARFITPVSPANYSTLNPVAVLIMTTEEAAFLTASIFVSYHSMILIGYRRPAPIACSAKERIYLIGIT